MSQQAILISSQDSSGRPQPAARSFIGHAKVIGVLTLVSRIMGMAREIVAGHYLGTGLVASAFTVAFTIPNLFRKLFGEGALSAAFIPLYAQALKKEREKLKEMTGPNQCFQPIPKLIESLNRQLDGWANYFRFGYPRMAFRQINWYVRDRLTQHLRRRSQRPFRPPEGSSYYEHLNKMGLRIL